MAVAASSNWTFMAREDLAFQAHFAGLPNLAQGFMHGARERSELNSLIEDYSRRHSGQT